MFGIGVVTAPVATQAAQAASRPDLNDVLRNYQAPDDKMSSWRPSAWGLIPIPFQDSVTLTETEGSLLDNLTQDRGLAGLSDFKDIRDDALSESRSRYPAPATIPIKTNSHPPIPVRRPAPNITVPLPIEGIS